MISLDKKFADQLKCLTTLKRHQSVMFLEQNELSMSFEETLGWFRYLCTGFSCNLCFVLYRSVDKLIRLPMLCRKYVCTV